MADSVAPSPPEPLSLRFAVTFFSRLRGLLGSPGSHPDDEALLIAPCHAIHTFGMTREIDVAFIDGAGRIIGVYQRVKVARHLRCSGSVAVIERFASEKPFFFEGDQLFAGPTHY